MFNVSKRIILPPECGCYIVRSGPAWPGAGDGQGALLRWSECARWLRLYLEQAAAKARLSRRDNGVLNISGDFILIFVEIPFLITKPLLGHIQHIF